MHQAAGRGPEYSPGANLSPLGGCMAITYQGISLKVLFEPTYKGTGQSHEDDPMLPVSVISDAPLLALLSCDDPSCISTRNKPQLHLALLTSLLPEQAGQIHPCTCTMSWFCTFTIILYHIILVIMTITITITI